MKLNSKLNLNDLLNDESFINWSKGSNQSDIAYWNNWINNNPSEIDTIYTAKAIILGITFKKGNIDGEHLDNSFNEVLKGIFKAESRVFPLRSSSFKKITAIAATGLILFLLSSIFLQTSNEKVYRTDYGEIIDIKLQDGTQVRLNGNSELRYNKEESRNVTLKGEAYFKVQPILTTNAKFWVHTDDLTVEVFGTQFNVNTWEDQTKVVLDEGSIKLKLTNGEMKEMKPQETFSFVAQTNKITHNKITPKTTYTSWKSDTYVFNNITLEALMKHLNHSYGLTYEFESDVLKTQKLSGGIPYENLELCLRAIEKSTGLEIIKKDNTILINNKPI